MSVTVPGFAAYKLVFGLIGTDLSDRVRGLSSPKVEKKLRSCFAAKRRFATPDRLDRHPVLQIIHKAQLAGLRIVPYFHTQRFTRRDLTHAGRVPMGKTCVASDGQISFISNFEGDRVHTTGSSLEVGIRNVFSMFGRPTGRTGISRNNNENRHRAANSSVTAKETK